MLQNDPTTPIELIRNKLTSDKDRELLEKLTDEHADLIRSKQELANELGYEDPLKVNYVSRS